MKRRTAVWRRVLSLSAGTLLIASGLMVAAASPTRAAEFSYKNSLTYTVSSNGTTHIAQHYIVTNHTSSIALAAIHLSAPTDQVRNLHVSYGDGATIPTTQTKKTTDTNGYKYDYIEIDINFNRTNGGNGTVWDFNIDYDTPTLVDTKGSAHTVYIPEISTGDLDQQLDAKLEVPIDFGKLHTYGSKPVYSGVDNGRSVYQLDSKAITKQALALVFGDSTIYHLNFNYPLHNNSSRDQTFTVTLPPDTPSQRVFINSLNPKPINLRLDDDGNVLADYRLSAGQALTVQTDIDGVVKYLDYDLTKSGTKRDIPANFINRYTSPQPYWQSTNPEIVAAAAKAAAPAGQNVGAIVKALNNFVIDRLTYNNAKIQYNIRQGAVKALENPTNVVCLEYSDLLVALLRSQGIPARMPIGYAYSGNLKTSPAVDDSLHSWVEAYVPNVGWMNVDPTWGEKFNNLGHSDLDHFAFAIWGEQDNSPTAVMQAGNDQNYQYENTKLSFRTVAPTAALVGRLKIKQYALLPFIAAVQYSLSAPANVAGTDYEFQLQDGSFSYQQYLGSLAPGQQISGLAPIVGPTFWRSATASFVQLKEGVPVLAHATSTVNYWPMVGILVLLSGILLSGVVQWGIRRRRKRRAQRRKTHHYHDPTAASEHTKLKRELAAKFRAEAHRAYVAEHGHEHPHHRRSS